MTSSVLVFCERWEGVKRKILRFSPIYRIAHVVWIPHCQPFRDPHLLSCRFFAQSFGDLSLPVRSSILNSSLPRHHKSQAHQSEEEPPFLHFAFDPFAPCPRIGEGRTTGGGSRGVGRSKRTWSWRKSGRGCKESRRDVFSVSRGPPGSPIPFRYTFYARSLFVKKISHTENRKSEKKLNTNIASE